jgi:hypothetical protein
MADTYFEFYSDLVYLDSFNGEWITESGGSAVYTKSASIDALIQKAMARTSSLDALIQQAHTSQANIDALIMLARSGVVSLDALVQILGTGSVGIDALLMALKRAHYPWMPCCKSLTAPRLGWTRCFPS